MRAAPIAARLPGAPIAAILPPATPISAACVAVGMTANAPGNDQIEHLPPPSRQIRRIRPPRRADRQSVSGVQPPPSRELRRAARPAPVPAGGKRHRDGEAAAPLRGIGGGKRGARPRGSDPPSSAPHCGSSCRSPSGSARRRSPSPWRGRSAPRGRSRSAAPAWASTSRPALRSQGDLLSAIRRTSTPRSRARTSASTMPAPVVRL